METSTTAASTATASPVTTQANQVAPAKPASPAVDPKAPATAAKTEPTKVDPKAAPLDPKAVAKEPVDGKEPTTDPKDGKPETKDRESERWAALSKQEKRIQAERSQLKEEIGRERQAFETERKAHQEQLASAAQIQREVAALVRNPRGVREFIEKYLDMDIRDLANDLIHGETPDYKIEQLEKRLAQKEADAAAKAEREQAENQTKAVQQAIANHKAAIGDFLKAPGNIESYELTAEEFGEDAPNQIFSVIETHFKTSEKETGTGVLLSIEEAAKLTEETLEKMYLKRLQTKKLSKHLKPEEPVKDVATSKDKLANSKESSVDTSKANNPISEQPADLPRGIIKKTLTNKNAQTVPVRKIGTR